MSTHPRDVVDARPSDRPWTTKPIADVSSEAKDRQARMNNAHRALRDLDEAAARAMADGATAAEVCARLDGIAADLRAQAHAEKGK